MDWNADFEGLPPIVLPDGRTLKTLAEWAAYILGLPKRQQQEPQWQHATAQLLKAAELGDVWRSFARMAFSRALDGLSGVSPPTTPQEKSAPQKGTGPSDRRVGIIAKADHLVTITGSRTLGHPDGHVAIRLETKEIGSITFEMDRRSIATFRKQLDAAEAFLNKTRSSNH